MKFWNGLQRAPVMAMIDQNREDETVEGKSLNSKSDNVSGNGLTTESSPAEDIGRNPDRWQVFRDLLAFQFKLALDAIRDLVLSPVSIATALFGVFTDQDNPGKYFYRLLQQGHKSDDWINLFGTDSKQVEGTASSSDKYVRKLESLVLGEYEKGGLVKELKDKTDRLIDKAKRD